MPKPVPIFLSPSNAKLLESLWNEHSGAVHSMLIAYCGNPDDAGDILQDLFLRLSRDPSTLAAMKSPRAFLNVSARRLAIDLARKRAADQRRQDSPEAVAHFHPAPAPPQADKDLGNIIRIALQKLPADQRAVAEARLFHGKTLALIAEEQGIPLNTVASRLRYSLDKLRDELRPHYEHMKNPNAQSSERLIKTLEPKRVPSVAPGLEGVAACAVFDHVDEAPVIAPCVEWDHQTETDSEICVFPPPEENWPSMNSMIRPHLHREGEFTFNPPHSKSFIEFDWDRVFAVCFAVRRVPRLPDKDYPLEKRLRYPPHSYNYL